MIDTAPPPAFLSIAVRLETDVVDFLDELGRLSLTDAETVAAVLLAYHMHVMKDDVKQAATAAEPDEPL